MKNILYIPSILLFLALVAFAFSLNIVFGIVVTIFSVVGVLIILLGVDKDIKEQQAADRRCRALYGLDDK